MKIKIDKFVSEEEEVMEEVVVVVSDETHSQ
jgi:hypothetical protein